MKNLKFLFIGIIFGIVLIKSEVVSWYRIYEMFKFQSFHMYGIIGSAVLCSMIFMQLFKKGVVKTYLGSQISIRQKEKGILRTLIGGTIFGFGWALIGACPGPMFALVGKGVVTILVAIIGATFGAFLYGLLRKKLPH